MDNQSSSPALTFPNVPDDFCPTGNWQNVFQVFIDEVLTNGTINVPGLGDVTPAQIAQINEDLADQQNQISANTTNIANLTTQVNAIPVVNVRRGVVTGVPSVPADSIQTVSFAALPNVNYAVSITPVCTGTIGTSATPLFSLNDGSKTTTGFSIRVENNISNITSIEWMAVHTS
jgi:hypothetical protein